MIPVYVQVSFADMNKYKIVLCISFPFPLWNINMKHIETLPHTGAENGNCWEGWAGWLAGLAGLPVLHGFHGLAGLPGWVEAASAA